MSTVRLKLMLVFICAMSAAIDASNNFHVTARNREVGSKLTYSQLQQNEAVPNLPVKLYYGSSTAAPTKIPITTTMTTTTAKHTSRPPSPGPSKSKPTLSSSTTERIVSAIRIPDHDSACGIAVAKSLYSPYVIGGQLAHPAEFPWFGAITKFHYTQNSKWKVVCGASVLNSRYAITAAHCLHGRYKDQLEIVFNLQDASNITYHASPGEIRRKISRFVIHPQYNHQTQHDDIALIQFKEPLDLKREKFLAPICLPDSSSNSYASRSGVFVGFGHTSYGGSSSKENSKSLMKVNVPILSHGECLKSKIPTKKNITENMICAGEQGKDACINDSGGPLMVFEKARVVLAGLASWGVGCALPDYPGVYTRVSSKPPPTHLNINQELPLSRISVIFGIKLSEYISWIQSASSV